MRRRRAPVSWCMRTSLTRAGTPHCHSTSQGGWGNTYQVPFYAAGKSYPPLRSFYFLKLHGKWGRPPNRLSAVLPQGTVRTKVTGNLSEITFSPKYFLVISSLCTFPTTLWPRQSGILQRHHKPQTVVYGRLSKGGQRNSFHKDMKFANDSFSSILLTTLIKISEFVKPDPTLPHPQVQAATTSFSFQQLPAGLSTLDGVVKSFGNQAKPGWTGKGGQKNGRNLSFLRVFFVFCLKKK